MFKALVLHREDGSTIPRIEQLSLDQLPDGDVLVAVEYSSLNYKDALAITGRGKIVREFPFVPGIDLAGTVLESTHENYQPGDAVLLSGWGVGERHWGGLAQRARVRGDWLLRLPAGLTPRRAMALGTAGLTAALCVMALEEHGIEAGNRPVLVTGASGGVGSIAVALLARAGFNVAAVTGKASAHDYLRRLGASEIVSREAMSQPARPLESQRWAGGVDTCGGPILARMLAETAYGGCVGACGLAADHHLETTVMPFILRGVGLQGVDSVQCPSARREKAWQRLADTLDDELIDSFTQEITLAEVPETAQRMMDGKIRGRTIVRLQA